MLIDQARHTQCTADYRSTLDGQTCKRICLHFCSADGDDGDVHGDNWLLGLLLHCGQTNGTAAQRRPDQPRVSPNWSSPPSSSALASHLHSTPSPFKSEELRWHRFVFIHRSENKFRVRLFSGIDILQKSHNLYLFVILIFGDHHPPGHQGKSK